jgi:NAD-dependent dihydropyrimidine dehydrogenase PreA subunit
MDMVSVKEEPMGFYVEIDAEKCQGCGKCVAICPKSLIKVVDGKAIVEEPDNCDGLAGCVKRCPEDAIKISRT